MSNSIATINTPAMKAFAVLFKNLNIWEMKELIGLLEGYIEEETQKEMADNFNGRLSNG